ncbi:unnamed protein product [Clonostachys byssicola]|uniref:Leptomycin B resistance protein pmd1 n=1 Tax=Clonostachys byssicola TaxID=160290 RepID=A0A9N9UCP3_9HYPO|nr:unnamed protein product [Clonostachys byssicola]
MDGHSGQAVAAGNTTAAKEIDSHAREIQQDSTEGSHLGSNIMQSSDVPIKSTTEAPADNIAHTSPIQATAQKNSHQHESPGAQAGAPKDGEMKPQAVEGADKSSHKKSGSNSSATLEPESRPSHQATAVSRPGRGDTFAAAESNSPDEDPIDRLPEAEAAILRRQIDLQAKKQSIFALLRFATKFDVVIIIISIICSIASGAALPIMTIVFGNVQGIFTDYTVLGLISLDEFKSVIGHYVLYFVYLAIGTFVVTYISSLGLLYVGEAITDRIRQKYLESCLRQNIGYFDKFGTGEFATKITADTVTIQDGISDKFGLFLSSLSTFVTGFVIGYVYAWKFALILTATLFALLLNGAIAAVFIIRYDTPMRENFSQSGTFIEEVFSSIRVAIAFGTQERLAKQYLSYLGKVRFWGIKLKHATALMTAGIMSLTYLNYGLGFWQGSVFMARGDLKLSDMIIVMMSIMMGTFNMSVIGPYFTVFIGALSVANKMLATIDRESPLDPSTDEGSRVDNLEGHIRLENIKHIYPSRADVTVLNNFSLDIPAGKVTALVGASGCGKSTIVGIVERFYEPVEGKVFLDGHDLSTLNIRWLRQQMALVGQEPTLFAATISENIKFGLIGTEHEDSDEEKQQILVEDAARQANAHDFIMQLPDGYQTNVGQRGFLLSGGQKQRIAIARAVISNPKILLLDEATSALDTKSEGIVQVALDNASTGRTTITIAHRLSTIRNADNIVVMSKGEIIEQGTHNDLISKQGAYHALVTAQTIEDSQRRSVALSVEEAISKEQQILKRVSTCKDGVLVTTEIEVSEKNMLTSSGILNNIGEIESGIASQKVPQHTMWTLVKFVSQFNRQEAFWILVAFFFCVLCGLATPVQAIFFAKEIIVLSDVELQGADRWAIQSSSNFWSLMFLMLGLVQFLTNAVSGSLLGWASEHLIQRLRDKTFSAMLRQDVSYYDEDDHNPGALTAYVAMETTHASGITGSALGTIIQSAANLVASLVLSLAIGWKLALVVFPAVPLAVACGFFRWWVLARHQRRIETVYAESAGFASESISAIRTVASLTREKQVTVQYERSLMEQQKKSIKSVAKSSLIAAAAQSVQYLCYGLGFWYGSTLMATFEYSLFQFFVCFMAMIMGASSVGSCFSFAPDLAKAKSAAAKLKTLIEDSKPLIDTSDDSGDTLTEAEGYLEFKDVIFRYPSRPHVPVLRGLNLKVEPGQHIALVGSSGCGKSTTIALLERFYDPLAGQVLLDGKDISLININDYRSHIALVSQEPTLFQGTIRENISMGSSKDLSDEALEIACREANIYDFILSLPEGFNTVVGSRGGLLSTGQKQRVAIARALVRQPKILLLDEATSALDSESEHVVQAALDRAAKGRTTVTVAHRLSTIQHADVIYVFDKGCVVESGTHSELMALNGAYAELVRMQSLDQKEEKRGGSA